MIKKLRMRMSLASILAFAMVVFLISVLVNLICYRIVTNQADDTLKSIMEYENRRETERPAVEKGPERKPPIPPFMGMNNPEAEYITRFFIVRYDETGLITRMSTDNIAVSSREETENLANIAIEKKKDSGYIEGYRYLKRSDSVDNIIVFLNVMQDQQHLKIFRIITLFVAVFSLIIVSVLVIAFSGTAVKPIVQNFEQQKQFITDASHELKTPLTSIMTSIDVITVENGENEWTENIKDQSKRMTKLVQELVTLSRLDEAKPLYAKEEFSLSDISWEILEIYEGNAKAKGRVLNTQIEDKLLINGDKSAIGQMISVLLDNAIKYSKGEGEIHYKVFREHGRTNIEVSNPTDYSETLDVNRLFDRFYRPDSSRNANDGGCGIGLAIAKAVVLEHGGKITAECPKGKRMIIKIKL